MKKETEETLIFLAIIIIIAGFIVAGAFVGFLKAAALFKYVFMR